MVQTIKYKVVRTIGKVEIRAYPKIVIAKVDDPNSDAFSLLYNFITGGNRQKEKVKMTSPVVSQKIAMTSPVLSDVGSMAFFMPEEFTLENTPDPSDNRVIITEFPERFVAALCFSGGWSEARFENETQELLDELAKAKIKTKGNVFTMLYNPPFMPGFLRRNEVAIEVEEATAPLI
jgi:hypothetical protein